MRRKQLKYRNVWQVTRELHKKYEGLHNCIIWKCTCKSGTSGRGAEVERSTYIKIIACSVAALPTHVSLDTEPCNISGGYRLVPVCEWINETVRLEPSKKVVKWFNSKYHSLYLKHNRLSTSN